MLHLLSLLNLSTILTLHMPTIWRFQKKQFQTISSCNPNLKVSGICRISLKDLQIKMYVMEHISLKLVRLRISVGSGDKTFKKGTLSSIWWYEADLFWTYLALTGFIEPESTGEAIHVFNEYFSNYLWLRPVKFKILDQLLKVCLDDGHILHFCIWWRLGAVFRIYSCCCCLVAKSGMTLVTPWTVAHQAPLSTGFQRQEYWSGLTFPSPADLPDLGIKPVSAPVLCGFFTTGPPGKLILFIVHSQFCWWLSIFFTLPMKNEKTENTAFLFPKIYSVKHWTLC